MGGAHSYYYQHNSRDSEPFYEQQGHVQHEGDLPGREMQRAAHKSGSPAHSPSEVSAVTHGFEKGCLGMKSGAK